jgi:hypothetical protein
MNKLLIACTAIAFGACAYAQDATPSGSMSGPSSGTMAGPSMGTADLTGQKIYDGDRNVIGVVDTMTTDANGKKMAVVSVDKHLGIGASRVLFPMNALQPRDKGGYMTNLSQDQISQLPKANATNTPTP